MTLDQEAQAELARICKFVLDSLEKRKEPTTIVWRADLLEAAQRWKAAFEKE